jgi:hypothetical protein
MFVCHRCDNPGCVNPAHLFVGTAKDNHNDMRSKGRHVNPPVMRGESNVNAKLNPEKVLAIRVAAASGQVHRDIAYLFAISIFTVGKVVRRETWGWV